MAQLYPGYFSWLPYLQAGLFVLALALVMFTGENDGKRWYRSLIAVTTVASMTLTPLAWSVDVINNPSSINPAAGPASLQMGGMGGGNRGPGPMGGKGGQGSNAGPGNFGAQDYSTLVAYLEANRSNAKYLVATFGAQAAAGLITATGENVLPIGGFDGSDPAPTLTQFKTMVSKGEVKFVLAGGGAGQSGKTQSTGDTIQSWVTENCTLDSAAPAGVTLYRCSAK
jgi:4-amino-4-deoxy-L-arabinose transferase-like glycosyltransferase